MATFERFEDIEAWKEARRLARCVYRITSDKPLVGDFVLRDQCRSAAISVMSNVAEGFEREGTQEFIHFLSIAKGSCGELRSQLYIAFDVGYISEEVLWHLGDQAEKTSRLIWGLMRYLRQCGHRGPKYKQA